MPTPRASYTAFRRSVRQRWTAIAVLSLVLLAGLIIRLKVAPAEGYGFDVGTNKSWAYSAVILGSGRSYTQQLKDDMLPNYPPLSMLFFQLSGWVYMHTISPTLDIDAPSFQTAIKSGSMVADLLMAVLLYAMLSRYKRNRWFGVVAAAIYLFHPVPIHDGAFWGQTDSEYAVFLVAAFGAFVYGFSAIAGCCMALALLTKFQAVACLPLFVILILKSGWRSTLKAVVGGFAVTALVLLPFWWTGFFSEVIHVYTSAIGYYDSVSSSAYNFWWSLYADEAGNMHDTALLFHTLSFRTIGMILFALSILYPIVLLWPHLRPSPKNGETLPAVFLAATLSAYAFFLWNTQMHERYSFAVIPLGLVVAFASTRAARLYVLVSLFIFLNFLGWLPIGFIDRGAYGEFPMLDVFVASALVLLFFSYAALVLAVRRMIPLPQKKPWVIDDLFRRLCNKSTMKKNSARKSR